MVRDAISPLAGKLDDGFTAVDQVANGHVLVRPVLVAAVHVKRKQENGSPQGLLD